VIGSAAAVGEYMRFKQTERYQYGWTDPRGAPLFTPTWEMCLICGRETPHIARCIYVNFHPSGNGIADRMRQFGLDPDNPEHCREFYEATRTRQAADRQDAGGSLPGDDRAQHGGLPA
jgi:hypothetical protein